MAFDINGANGRYDTKEADTSVRYGRNAVDNYLKYMESPIANDKGETAPILDFVPTVEADQKNIQKLEKYVNDNDAYMKSLPPLEYEYRYMPNLVNGQINKKALFGAAMEEMGSPVMPVKEFEDKFLISDDMTAKPIDINHDGKIDVPEYSTTILAADMMSKPNPDIRNIDGTINSKGFNAVLAYSQKSRAEAAAKLYSNIYTTHKLGDIQA